MGINKLSRLLSDLGIHDDVVKILNENDVSGSLLLFFMMGGSLLRITLLSLVIIVVLILLIAAV
jgi:hypothetical protein